MNSLLFNVLIKILRPVYFILALWLLFRGHNAPGGGFIAGLIAASASILQILSQGWDSLNKTIRDKAYSLAGLGLLISILSGTLSIAQELPFMTGVWRKFGNFSLGSPQLFDVGVFIVVYSVVVLCAGYQLDADEKTFQNNIKKENS